MPSCQYSKGYAESAFRDTPVDQLSELHCALYGVPSIENVLFRLSYMGLDKMEFLDVVGRWGRGTHSVLGYPGDLHGGGGV